MKPKLKLLIGLSTSALLCGVGIINIANSFNETTYEDGILAHKVTEEEKASLNFHCEPAVSPTDTYFNTQKDLGLKNIGDIQSVWDSYTGKGIKIAIIDTGIDYDHPDFTDSNGINHIDDASRYYFYNSTANQVQYYQPGVNCNWDKLLPDFKDNKYNSHGVNSTSCAASTMNGEGVVGVAPDATILALKTDFQWLSIIEAIKYATSQGADVINMSIQAYEHAVSYGSSSMAGSTGISTYTSMISAISSAVNKGCIVVAAAGNYNTTEKSYPASYPKVIGVGALGRASQSLNTRAAFSNFNDSSDSDTANHSVDMVAAGYVYAANTTGSTSTSHSHGYVETQGTSFSSPIVAGAAALYKEKYPNATYTDFLAALADSCDDIGATGWDPIFGYGRLNVSNLLAMNSEVSGVELDKTSIEGFYNHGDKTVQLTATVKPASASEKSVTWTSSDSSVATVSSTGLVTLVGAGTATITVRTNDGGFTANCNVNSKTYVPVTSAQLLDTNNSASGSLLVGEHMQLHAVVTPSNASVTEVNYDSENSAIASVSESGYITANSAGSTKIYAFVGNEMEYAEYSITVKPIPRVLQSISITTAPSKLKYNVGDTFSLNGATITGTFSASPTSQDITSYCTFSPSGSLTESDKSVTISYTYEGVTKTVTQAITVSSGSSPSTYTLLSDASDLHDGDSVLFVGQNGTNYYAMSKTQNSNNRGQSAVTIVNSSPKTITTVPTDACEFVANAVDSNWSFYDADKNGYLAAASSSSNYLKTVGSVDGNSTWAISFSGTTMSVIAQGNYSRNNLRYNSSGNLFSCYGSGQNPVSIYYKKSASPISVTGVTLNKTSLTLDEGASETLTATVVPSDATNKNVTWTSSNTSVATVSNGVVTAVKAGTTTITVKTSDGNYSATCNLTVKALPVLTSITIDTNPSKLTYNAGESFSSTGAIVTAHYDDGSSKVVTSNVTWTPAGALTTSNTTATASYTEKNVTKTATVAITVKKAVVLSSITIDTNPSKLIYNEGESFSSSGAVVTAHYTDSSSKNVTSQVTWTPSGALTATTTSITASYTEGSITKTATVDITVNKTQSSGGCDLDFTSISGFSGWASSYSQHVVEYDDCTVTFASASKQSSTINNMPVTKGGNVTIVMKNNFTLTGAEFVCQKWTTKSQTITLHYSTDGTTYNTTGITSSNFTISSDSLPAGTVAVRISFSSSTSQVGIKGANLKFAGGSSGPTAEEKAIEWAQSFNTTLICNAAGTSAPSKSIWSSLQTSYASLDSEAKAYFVAAKYFLSADGLTVTPTDDTDIDLAKAAAKYDYIVGKYGANNYANFALRTITQNSNRMLANNDTTMLGMITIMFATMSFIGLIVFKSKRKQEN